MGKDYECKAPPKRVKADPYPVLATVGGGTDNDGVETIMTKPNLASNPPHRDLDPPEGGSNTNSPDTHVGAEESNQLKTPNGVQ